jgi:hypothetical protein
MSKEFGLGFIHVGRFREMYLLFTLCMTLLLMIGIVFSFPYTPLSVFGEITMATSLEGYS